MARRWRRRSFVIGIIIVALTVALVFATLGYLRPPPVPHGSIQTTYVHWVAAQTGNGPGSFGLSVTATTNEPFAVNVTVTNGMASFCVISAQTYFNFASAYNSTSPVSFPSGQCTFGPTQGMGRGILNFGLTPGDWDIVALNYGSLGITVYYSPA